jgi:hypothetical protein
MTRSIVLRALGAIALVAALAPLPAFAGHNVRLIATMLTASADRTWVTVYRSEFSGMKREIVASGWMGRGGSFSTDQYNGDHYFFRAQVHVGDKIVADTTVEIDPRRHQFVELVGSQHGYYWHIPR